MTGTVRSGFTPLLVARRLASNLRTLSLSSLKIKREPYNFGRATYTKTNL